MPGTKGSYIRTWYRYRYPTYNTLLDDDDDDDDSVYIGSCHKMHSTSGRGRQDRRQGCKIEEIPV